MPADRSSTATAIAPGPIEPAMLAARLPYFCATRPIVTAAPAATPLGGRGDEYSSLERRRLFPTLARMGESFRNPA